MATISQFQQIIAKGHKS